MIEIAAQVQQNGMIKPFSMEDKEALKVFKPNQLLKLKISGIKKERSVIQLRLFFACCNYVANNIKEFDLNHPKFINGSYWNTKEKVAFQIKVALHFVDESKTIVYQDRIVFHYRSISFKNLQHLEACLFFDRAYPLLSSRIGLNEIELVEAAKQLIGG